MVTFPVSPWRPTAILSIFLPLKNGTTTGRIDAKRSVITKYNQKKVLCGLKPPTIGFSGRYREISGFFFSADSHFYLSPASGSCLELQADMHKQVHVHSGMPCEFNHYMHACLARNLHCHIVAMGMTLLQLPNSLSSTKLTLEVLSIKHWRQSAFAETLSTTRRSREARLRRASMLVYIYIPHMPLHKCKACAIIQKY